MASRHADGTRAGSLTTRLRVRLTPSGGADRIDGRASDESGAYLKARVRVAPEDSKANAALCALIAKALGVAKSKITVARGGASRMKVLEIEGATDAEIVAFMVQLKNL